MPIYEFYCEPCNTIFSFFARSVNTKASPSCPHCNAALKRRMSVFACINKKNEEDTGAEVPFDESKIISAMEKIAAEADCLNEENPRKTVDLMRKFLNMTGMKQNIDAQHLAR